MSRSPKIHQFLIMIIAHWGGADNAKTANAVRNGCDGYPPSFFTAAAPGAASGHPPAGQASCLTAATAVYSPSTLRAPDNPPSIQTGGKWIDQWHDFPRRPSSSDTTPARPQRSLQRVAGIVAPWLVAALSLRAETIAPRKGVSKIHPSIRRSPMPSARTSQSRTSSTSRGGALCTDPSSASFSSFFS